MSSIGRSSRSTSAPGAAASSDSGGARARRIAVVLHDLPLGGTERIALRLAGRWADLGREVTLIVGTEAGPLRAMVPANVELVVLDPPVPRGRGSRARLGRAAATAIAARGADVVFIPGNFHWPVVPAVAALPNRPRIVAQLSAPLRRRDRGRLGQAAYDLRASWQLRRADALVSLSDAMTAEADAIFGAGRTTRIALPALEDDAPPPIPVDPANHMILCVGRLVPEKGFVTAVDAVARLNDPTTKLFICGEGPTRSAILDRAAALGVEVSLPGYVPSSRPWLDEARLLLVASDYEGYGAVIVEALAAGRSVVATDCSPSVAELVVPSGGAAAPVGDAEALARGLRRLLDAPPRDPATLARFVDDYRLGPSAEAYLQLFDAA